MKVIKKLNYLFIFPLILFLYFITIDINLPFVGPNATNFNVYSLIAHNFNKFGYLQTKLTPLISVYNTYPTNPAYFFHHPTLLSFVESLLFKILGESFWVGRLTVILFALGSLFLVYLIGQKLINKKFGLISAVIYSIIPASTIFGKLIGQEPLVLFFYLLTLFFVLEYLIKKQKKYLILSALSIILGILSDWPAVIFAFCLLPLFYKNKKIREGFLLILIGIGTIIALFAYTIIIRGNLADLQSAFSARSITGLLSINNWPIAWVKIWIARIIIYFGPFVAILASTYFYLFYKNRKKLKNIELVILSLFLFGFLHEVLYLQAVFSHNYLIYYFLPFVVFSSSFVMLKLFENKKYILLCSIFVVSILYLLAISNIKSEQVKSNVWRYDLVKVMSTKIDKYETVAISDSDSLNTDILWYPFLINWKVEKGKSLDIYSKNYKHYILTCTTDCKGYERDLSVYRKEYTYIRILAPGNEFYLFSLNINQKLNDKTVVIRNTSGNENEFIKNNYDNLRKLLNLPQI